MLETLHSRCCLLVMQPGADDFEAMEAQWCRGAVDRRWDFRTFRVSPYDDDAGGTHNLFESRFSLIRFMGCAANAFP